MPYCNAGWPVLGERKTWFNAARASATGNEALSVKPAASEISLGRDNAAYMSHEMGGSTVRWPIFDKYDFMQRNGDGNSEFEIGQPRNMETKVLEYISFSKQLSLAPGFSRVIPVVAIIHPFQRVQVFV
jgi:hypothetical protein